MLSIQLCRRMAAVGAAITLAVATSGVAQAAIDPSPVAPDQFFTGLVNGAAGASRIEVICDGPIDLVPLGHPVAGQTIAAEPVMTGATSAAGVGFTGRAARALDVRLGIGTKGPLTLRFYHASAAIPATDLVPCSGSGTVTFAPNPDSANARSATVTVTFVSRAAMGRFTSLSQTSSE